MNVEGQRFQQDAQTRDQRALAAAAERVPAEAVPDSRHASSRSTTCTCCSAPPTRASSRATPGIDLTLEAVRKLDERTLAAASPRRLPRRLLRRARREVSGARRQGRGQTAIESALSPLPSALSPVTINLPVLLDRICYRYPSPLVDAIIEQEPGRLVGVKNVTLNEEFFQGHFPGTPLMPGVLMLESLSQLAAVLLLHRDDATPDARVVPARRQRHEAAPAGRAGRSAAPRDHARPAPVVARARAGGGVRRRPDRRRSRAAARRSCPTAPTFIRPPSCIRARTSAAARVIGPHAVIGPHVRIGDRLQHRRVGGHRRLDRHRRRDRRSFRSRRSASSRRT